MLLLARLLCTLLLVTLPAFAVTPAIGDDNPIFNDFNEPIKFDKITVEHVKSATEEGIKSSKATLQSLCTIPAKQRTFENTMLALDDMYNELSSTYGCIYILSNAHPDKDVRTTSNDQVTVFSKYYNEIGLDEELYRSVKEYAHTDEAKKLSGYKAKFVTETVRSFERNGFALPKEKRSDLKVIQDKISDLGISFSKNIADYKDSLVVTEAEMDGLQEDYKTAHRRPVGTYTVGLTYPDYQPFMKYSKSESARKALYTKYNNRASNKNLDVLKDMLVERQRMASLLGYKTFAQYQVEERMVKKPEVVWNFENTLIDKVKMKARMDYDELLEMKQKHGNDPVASVINPWESSFYNNLLLIEKYQLDQEQVKEYFELNTVLDGLFSVAQTLFSIKFNEISSPSVWHKDVRLFEVTRDGKTIGRFYLDLFPRENKFTHAACFRIIGGKETARGYQLPQAALLCNFPPATADKPALMPHSQVETFFHEFGHVLHNMLTTAPLNSMSGTSVARDFVEAPSQIFENWTWDYASLTLFAKHYKTGEPLPKQLFDKMLAAKNVGSGLATSQQILYGVLDMTYHDGYDPNGPESTTEVVKRLQNKITLYPFLEGTNFQAAFGHLTGYAAGYYGYLWSQVYSADMFSVFEKNGILDPNTGGRYRDIILAKGATEEELNLVKQFLGREPNEEAFLKGLGLTTGVSGGSGGTGTSGGK
ncbi:MAG: M3 family metallopeptidase [Bacteroidota bacterium]